ncbi:MAG TPA: TrmH family RNA methyltransferase [Miltoncostaeaceae bacterium]|nr:TrmH family RNA methyltransferase [Miltoncostaeaceae bacterium]
MSDLRNPAFPGPEGPGDPRNLIDHPKYWREDAVRAALDRRRHAFAPVLENFAYDFNVATAVRNANAFLAREVWIVGRRRWDRRGAQGTHRYEHVRHAATTGEAVAARRAEGYRVVVVDNVDGASSLLTYRWPERALMVFGQEQIGVSHEALRLADDVVYIPQYGSTRSINVGTASGIAMFAWAAQHAGAPRPWPGPGVDQAADQ